MKISKRSVLIPAAGFGVRVGSPPAKELLVLSCDAHRLIDFSIGLAAICKARPLVVTRRSKTALIEAMEGLPEVELELIDESVEWPDTILQAEKRFARFNLVLLPDTRFAPTMVVHEMFSVLEQGAPYVFATFSADALDTWGCVAGAAEAWQVCEKPRVPLPGAMAWGIFGFQKEHGKELLERMLASSLDHEWKPLKKTPSFLPLDHFTDLTR